MMKDVDSATRARFLQGFFWLLFPMFFIGGVLTYAISGFNPYGFLIMVVITVSLAAFGSLMINLLLNREGGIISTTLGHRSWRSVRENLQGDVERAKWTRREGDIETALNLLDQVLEQDESNPEALYTKAQILLEQNKTAPAAKTLRTLLQTNPKENEYYRWGKALLQEISRPKEEMESRPVPEENGDKAH
jgi:tetratricopeptide (TPR) repeat protein